MNYYISIPNQFRKDSKMKHGLPIRAAALCLILCTILPALISCNSFSDTEYAIVSEGNISSDGFIYDKYENSTVKITGIESMPVLLTIPAEIDGMPVVEIGDSAFAGDQTLLYLEFPSADIKLGNRFCSGCTSLASVDLADSITSIPPGAFEECKDLSMVDGTSAITEIGSQAFASCTALAYFKISDKLTSLGDEAFRGCTSLASLNLPETLTFIGESAFWGCENLVKVSVKGSAEIPKYAFLDCISLTEITLGENIESIGEEAFRNCRALYTVRFGKNLKSINSYAFHACDSLTETVFDGNKDKISIAEGNEALGAAEQGGTK